MKLYKEFCNRISKKHVRAAILMSGGGSNARNILRNRNLYPNIEVSLIVTDKNDSNAFEIAKDYGVKYLCVEGSVKNVDLRTEYFKKLAKLLHDESIEIILYAGFMKIVTEDFLNEFPGINSHPADLRILDRSGNRKYVGMDAVEMTIKDNQKTICCSCFLIETNVDDGRLIAVSKSIKINKELNPSEIHTLLKESEWKYYPEVIKLLAKKKLDTKSKVYIF